MLKQRQFRLSLITGTRNQYRTLALTGKLFLESSSGNFISKFRPFFQELVRKGKLIVKWLFKKYI